LRQVLSASDDIQLAEFGNGVSRSHGYDIRWDPAPREPLGEDDRVARVSVGTEEVRKKKGDGDL
jgi:hypothetical protein